MMVRDRSVFHVEPAVLNAAGAPADGGGCDSGGGSPVEASRWP